MTVTLHPSPVTLPPSPVTLLLFIVLVLLPLNAEAQRLLTLDSCRAMALRNNKQMSVAKARQEVAAHVRKSARTKYLPHVGALGGYVWTSKEISILNDDQKSALNNLGTNAATGLSGKLAPYASILPPALQMQMAGDLGALAGMLNQAGQGIVNGLRTDTRNMFAGAVVVTQPVFMGGAIIAANKMADIGEEMAAHALDARQQSTLFDVDKAYWQVVSLCHKEKLAESYLELVKKLDNDVQKMLEEGVATRSDRLKVGVKVNEAEMALTKASDGVVLSKMLLCQLCGLPVSQPVVLADEAASTLTPSPSTLTPSPSTLNPSPSTLNPSPSTLTPFALQNRSELKLLENSVALARQTANLLKAGNLPQVLLTGGYAVSNPNVLNGFQKKFGGFWNVGVMVHVPIWNWGDVRYKVRAAKGAATIASLELEDAREMVELQVSQKTFLVNEATKKLTMAQSNIAHAEENLRTATIGFQEGVISSTTVMEAQTAWLQAQSQKIDAEIDVRLSQVELQKALGTLAIEN